MDPLIVFLIVIMTVITILLSVVFVYIILVLRQLRETLTHLNHTLSNTDRLVEAIANPFENMGGMVTGLKTGLQLTETFVTWLKQQQNNQLR